MITRANELRHRLRFRLWTVALRAQLRRRGARLVVEAPAGARMDSAPHVRIEGRGGTVTLRIGRGVKLGRALHIDLQLGGDSTLAVAEGVYFMHGVRLQLRGGTIELGPHTHVRDGAVLKADGALRVGEEVTISWGDVIACTERIEIGDRVGLGERVTITDSDHTHDGSREHYLRQPLRVEPVALGENVLVSANAVVLRGARLGANSVVAAGAVVGAGDHPPGWLIAGVPAKPVRALGTKP